ncbi:MAG: hypothetical protein AABW80_03750 [Nanoarchaeota archaeon]
MLRKTRINDSGVRKPSNVLGAVVPIFKREDFEEHLEEIVRESPRIKEYIERNPRYRELLKESIRKTYDKFKYSFTGAKLIDSWDRVTSAFGLVAEGVPGFGQVASASEDVVELIPKLLYTLYYSLKTKDYKSVPYFALMEATSFIPVVGDILVDFRNIYLNRVRKTFRKKVADSFLEEMVKPPIIEKNKI